MVGASEPGRSRPTAEACEETNHGDHAMQIGFAGLGTMGQPMALRLRAAGMPIIVWNRSGPRCEPLRAAGATVAATPQDLFRQAEVVFLMLADEAATDEVLGRGTAAFEANVSGRIIVHMGTTAPDYSNGLGGDIGAAGGDYVECPVSGSKPLAESGELLALIAGRYESVAKVRPMLEPMCHARLDCCEVPSATRMKLAVNLFLITMVTGLAEAFHFASRQGLDAASFEAALAAGPMASRVSRMKGEKLRLGDFAAQAALADVLKNNRLVADAARAGSIASPLLDVCHGLYADALDLGHGQSDMVAVIRAIEARTDGLPE